MRKRYEDLDRAKGLGILLVVFGHIVARQPPDGNDWYILSKTVVYFFHMPFFMYLSGYVTFLSGASSVSKEEWPRFSLKRSERLLLPFVIFGLLIVLGKLVFLPYVHVDNPPSSLFDSLRQMIWDTKHSPVTSIWYIAVLFVFCVVTPPLLWLFDGRVWVVLIGAFVLYFLSVPQVMYMDRMATYFVFFLLGGMASNMRERWLSLVDRFHLYWCLIFIGLVFFFLLFRSETQKTMALLLCGIFSMPALHGFVRRKPAMNSRMLLSCGKASFVVYLLNTPFIGAAKALFLEFSSWDGPNFLFLAPVLMVAGVAGPILIKKWVFSRIPLLDRLTS